MTDKMKRRLEIWRSLTPAQRDYDRYVGRIPYGASSVPETAEGAKACAEHWAQLEGRECTCHVSAPCSFCLDAPAGEAEKP